MILYEIKNTCRFVMNSSEHVKINYCKLDKFIKNIDCSNLENWLMSNPYNLLDLDTETIVNLLLVFECICYSFWGDPK